MTEPSLDDDAGRHLDLDALADHLAGEGDTVDRADGTAAHLAGCAGCRARLAELEAADAAVLASLAGLAPLTVPADVADRLTASLAALPALRPTTGTGPGPVPSGTVTPITAARSRRAWLPSVAAAGLLVLGGLLGYGILGSAGDSSSDSATTAAAPEAGADAPADDAFPTVTSGTDYADAAAVARSLPAVLSGEAASVALAPADSTAADGSAPPDGSAAPGGTAEQDLATTQAVDPLARLREPAALADCLAAVLDPADPDERPLALDYASYDGQPGLAVVLPDADPAKVAVFVVGPDCSRADDDLAFFTRLDRP